MPKLLLALLILVPLGAGTFFTLPNLLDRQILQDAGASEIIIMHPLPRDSRMDSFDLSSDVDDLPGLSIFRQTDNGVLIRMAIFLTALGCSPDAVKATTKQRPWDATLRWP